MESKYIKDLDEKGYCVIENILNPNEIFKAKELFYDWYKSIPNIDVIHSTLNPHNIFKFHEVGHQEFAWYLRTRPQIIKTFADLYNTNMNNLVTSFDGSCYYKPNTKLSDGVWTHTDISPKLSNEKFANDKVNTKSENAKLQEERLRENIPAFLRRQAN